MGVFGPASATPESVLLPALGTMRARGSDQAMVRREDSAALGVSRAEWEMAPRFSGGALVVQDEELLIAADAALFYRDDLRRALRSAGIEPRGDSASHLILAAYRAWGERCAERLEGDFAFVLWDTRSKRICCARDFYGTRPLFYAARGESLLVASAASALVAHPTCPPELNAGVLAATAAGLFAHGLESCYRGVRILGAGSTLVWQRGGGIRIFRHWNVPPVGEERTTSFEEGAEELRSLLTHAVRERLDPASPTSIWLSGGWDSTAVFASGEAAIRQGSNRHHLRPVSISYPPGDPGREDELINAVAERWDRPVHWLKSIDVPLWEHPLERAATRDQPFAHTFEQVNRVLSRASREIGTRVGLSGTGGDQLFQVSNIYLADLFRSGRWYSLWREWNAKGMRGSGGRNFFEWVVQPALPEPLLHIWAWLRKGERPAGYLERTLPVWFDPGFVHEHHLIERDRANTPARTCRSRASYETQWYLTHELAGTFAASIAGIALEEGVEGRAPLYDRRIVEFAVSRPRDERSAGRETKRLLRASMKGLLPDHILAPRRHRTGVTGQFFHQTLRERHADCITQTLNEPLALADFGIVQPEVLRDSWERYRSGASGELAMSLFFTLQTEWWLRARRVDNESLRSSSGSTLPISASA